MEWVVEQEKEANSCARSQEIWEATHSIKLCIHVTDNQGLDTMDVFSVCDDYYKMFYACDRYNKAQWQWELCEAGTHSSLMFGCIIQNTVNAYSYIMNVDSEDFEYFSYCQTLANDLYVHASTLSDSTIQQSSTISLIECKYITSYKSVVTDCG